MLGASSYATCWVRLTHVPPYFLRFFDAVVAFFDDAFLDVGPAGGA